MTTLIIEELGIIPKRFVYLKGSNYDPAKKLGAVDDKLQETATGTFTLSASRSTSIDSSGGAVTGTLGDGDYIGQLKTIVMTEASNSSTVSITNHETSDPEVATFDAVDEYLLLVWTGTEWATVSNTCTFV